LVGEEEAKLVLEKFSKAFQTKVIPEKTQLDFSWKGDLFLVSINDEEVASFQDANLCKAFFGLYLGRDARAGEIRTKMLEGVARFQ
jgi:hypothetical protein